MQGVAVDQVPPRCAPTEPRKMVKQHPTDATTAPLANLDALLAALEVDGCLCSSPEQRQALRRHLKTVRHHLKALHRDLGRLDDQASRALAARLEPEIARLKALRRALDAPAPRAAEAPEAVKARCCRLAQETYTALCEQAPPQWRCRRCQREAANAKMLCKAQPLEE